MAFSLREEIKSLLNQRTSKTLDVRHLFDKVVTTRDPADIITELELMETQGEIVRVGDTRIRLNRNFTDYELKAQLDEDAHLRASDLVAVQLQRLEKQVETILDNADSLKLIASSDLLSKSVQLQLESAAKYLTDYANSLRG